jgi:hypothetical protein
MSTPLGDVNTYTIQLHIEEGTGKFVWRLDPHAAVLSRITLEHISNALGLVLTLINKRHDELLDEETRHAPG